jgi:serine/threonine protein kinase
VENTARQPDRGTDVARAEDLKLDPVLAGVPLDAEGRPTVGGIPLLRRIGRGGMGTVYFAIHPRLNVEVAVKVLPGLKAERDPASVERFMNEAKLTASLRSENIVKVHDVGKEGPAHFLVMEFIAGETAGDYLRRLKGQRRQGLDEREAIKIVKAATRGLAIAHAKGIVHRDIKPDNILIPGGEPLRAKLADLGLAKLEGQGGGPRRVAMGTPGYMAPEQAADAKQAGPPADVFSMGATLYSLLTGRSPFPTASFENVRDVMAEHDPEPLPTSVSAATRALVARCMARDPAQRYANAQELLQALEEAEANPDLAPPKSEVRMEAPSPTPPVPEEAGGAGMVILGLLLAGGLAAAVIWLLLRG